MRLILQIFRKDTRQFALPIVILIVLEIAAAIADAQQDNSARRYAGAPFSASSAILALIWTFLVAAVILQERLPGTRQYWLTRPISWLQLVAAKALFVSVFVSGSLFLIDCITLAAVQLPINPWALVGSQVRLAVMLLLPTFCVTSTARSLYQVMFGLIGILVGASLLVDLQYSMFDSSQASDIPPPRLFHKVADHWLWLAVLSFTLGVTLFQYARRNGVGARFLLLAPLAAIFAATNHDWLPAIFVENDQSFDNLPAVQISLDIHRARPPVKAVNDDFVGFQIPVKIEGLPPSTVYVEGWAEIGMDTGGASLDTCTLYKDQSGSWLRIPYTDEILPELRRKPVDINWRVQLVPSKMRTALATRVTTTYVFSPESGVQCRSLSADMRDFSCWSGVEKRLPRRYLVFRPSNPNPTEWHSLDENIVEFVGLLHAPVNRWHLYTARDRFERNARRSIRPWMEMRIVSLSQLGTVDVKLLAHEVDLAPYFVKP